MSRTLWVFVALLCTPVVASAEAPRLLSQYAHSAWRVQQGFLGGSPRAIAQTTDGYLWIGTSAGLLHFDGVRFVAGIPANPAPAELSGTVYSLLGSADGTLWIGVGSTLVSLKNGRLSTVDIPRARINAIAEDRRGTVWLGRSRLEDGMPLCAIAQGRLRCYGAADGVSLSTAVALTIGSDDTVWAGNASGLLQWTPGAASGYAPAGLQSAAGQSGVSAVAEAPDGSVWVGMVRTGKGLGLQRLREGQWNPVVMPGFDGSRVTVNALLQDRNRAMWIGTDGDGLYRVSGGRVDRFTIADGLSGGTVTDLFEDREGNVWVSTTEGLDCFRTTPVITFSMREGMTANQAASVLASRDGTVWVGNQGGLDAIRGSTVSSITPKNGLPGVAVTSLLEDRSGRLWVGVDNGLTIYHSGNFRPVTLDGQRALGVVVDITEDSAGDVWALTVTPSRLLRLTDVTAHDESMAVTIPVASSLVGDREDGIWLGLNSGDLGRYRNGRFETFPVSKSVVLPIRQLSTDVAGTIFGATFDGLLVRRNGATRTLTVGNGLPCGNVYSFAFDQTQAVWLYAPCGVLKIAPSDLDFWWEHPEAVISVTRFAADDGARPALPSFSPAASRGPDGRLWFANELVAQVIDPARVSTNRIPPPVHIEHVVADRRDYSVSDIVRLPPLTRDVQIDFTGLSFVAPQKVLFRYQLEGRDDGWQEAGTRRQAFYNDLPPGEYRFRVIARNNDGVWNEQAATVTMVVLPAWYQTRWFLVVAITFIVFMAWTVYQWRIRRLARTLNARFDERLNERTRMARDLHDTLLQTVQGSKMVADNALNGGDDIGSMRRSMEQVSAWLGQASSEGRAAVNALRSSTSDLNDLGEAFERAMEDCRRHGHIDTSLSISGSPRILHPVVRDELYRVGYEAIRNACMHSGGRHLVVSITYGRDLIVRISDDGVGIDADVATGGKAGHFGVPGMRERARRIGADLHITRSIGGGTEITVALPGRVAFQKPASGFFRRLKRRVNPPSE